MTIKKRLSIICLIFSIIPLFIVFWLGVKSGLTKNSEFQHGMALALMSAIFLGMFSSGLVRYWLIGKQLEKIRTFCLAVKDGCYDVFLPVPNESSDMDDENEMVELMRNMNGMAHHIKFNEVQLHSMVTNLEQSQEKIASQNEELEKAYGKQLIVQGQLENQADQLTEMVNKIRSLLDNAGQGFVSFGKDLIVAAEYSAECVMIFNREIGGETIPKLLFPHDEKQEQFIAGLLAKIIAIDDDFLRENYISLLPQEIIVDQNYIKIDYKFINHLSNNGQGEMMLILTDVTKEKSMSQQIQAEKDLVTMIVKVVTHYQEFSAAVADYTTFCQEKIPTVLNDECPVVEKISILFTLIHTWKGTFGQLGMQGIVQELHGIEGVLAGLREEKNYEFAELIKCFPDAAGANLYNSLVREVEILTGILGDEFFLQENKVSVEKIKIRRIKELVNLLPESVQKQKVAFAVEMLGYRPFHELLHSYPQYVVELAARYGKGVEKFSICGGEILVNPAIYHDFSQTLVHVFRNAVAHGLETREERSENGKKEIGRIQCEILVKQDHIIIHIVDDGRGINIEKIKELALKKKIVDQKKLATLSDDEVHLLIFHDGFSSAECIDDIAGRGMGLHAIHKEVEKLGGEIRVASQVGIGTEFSFILPLENAI